MNFKGFQKSVTYEKCGLSNPEIFKIAKIQFLPKAVFSKTVTHCSKLQFPLLLIQSNHNRHLWDSKRQPIEFNRLNNIPCGNCPMGGG